MNNELKNIFLNHQGKLSDKWSLYLEKWDEIFSPFRNHEIDLLEIGIQNGGSLEIWAKYFDKAKNIIGCDIDEACKKLEFDDPRISVIVGDANTDDIEKEITRNSPNLDIIIDDGSHKSSDIIKSFFRYFRYLNDYGIYLIEDLHASYWEEHEGGLYYPCSSMNFLKRLADIINFEHWRNNQSIKNFLNPYETYFPLDLDEFDLNGIHSIGFFNSLCIIQKASPAENDLGERIVVGNDEIITKGWKKTNRTRIHDITVSINDFKNFEIFNLIKKTREQESTIDELKRILTVREQTINDLNSNLTKLEQEVLYYVNSNSWHITRPLRKLARLFKRIFK